MSTLDKIAYYESAHRECHPETCACPGNYRIIYQGEHHSYEDNEEDAKKEVKRLKLKAES